MSMTLTKFNIVNALLWAAAILLAAILGAPTLLTTVIIPALAVSSLFFISQFVQHYNFK